MALKTLRPQLKTLDVKRVQFQEKRAEPFYASPEWKARRLEVLKRDRFTCVLCLDRAVIVDHKISRRNGGGEDDANLRSLCRTCDNRLKEDALGQRRGSGNRLA